MTVTDVLSALGSWDITLKSTAPPDLWDRIEYFGHVAFIPGRLDPTQYGDNLLTAARYVGVVRTRSNSGDDRRTKIVEQGYELGGVGMAMWLGDQDNKGDVFETAVDINAQTFANSIRALLPASGAVTEGTLHAVAGTYSSRHQYETPRQAITYVCDTFTASSGAKVGWRVNGDGSLDAGPEADLYVTDPRCVISRKTAGKDTSGVESVPGAFGVSRDVKDFSTRVVLLAEGEGESIATGAADISPGLNPYKDIHGNDLKLVRLASESDTTVVNADTRAALLLDQYTSSRDELVVETDNFYIEGSFDVGDYVWVYDPNAGLVDTANEITFRGERLNPIRLQVTEARWPITEGYTVAYRDADGVWYDLTDHVEWDTSHTVYVTVGGFARALEGAGGQPVGSRPSQDTSVPAAPTWVTPFTGGSYLTGEGFTRARVVLAWNAPLNVDGSTIIDGDHYEIQHAPNPGSVWQNTFVGWGASTGQLVDLSPGVSYDVRIRAVDKSGNTGAWSATETFVAAEDTIAPSTPAAPTVAASRIAVQITHQLGKASGGTFNLESDLDHFEIHVGGSAGFTPDATTLKGKAPANSGMIQAGIPVVATVQVEETTARHVKVIAVDITGNKSGASTAASATALLIDDAHISDLTVTKVTAGTVSANWLLAASIRTAASGARVELNASGLQAYNAGGTQTVNIAAADGSVTLLGQIISGTSGRRLEIMPTSTFLPELRFYANTGANYAFINASSGGADSNIGVNSGTFDDSGVTVYARAVLTSGTSQVAVVRDDTQARRGAYSHYSSTQFNAGFHSGGTDGGIFNATSTAAKVGWDNGTTTTANYWRFSSGRTRHIGQWADYAAVDSNEGLFTGHVVTSGGTGVSLTYGPTMDSFLRPVVTIYDNILHTFGLTAESATGFTVDISPAGSGNWDVDFWCFRN
ncbi:fibronectin type III domain-containing protein [Streptomyces liliifuscus]|uniref:Fibronectin type III domain-containing protein n=1 Tax=Streptomyces liliifuscus TaxID=2797636 RepID=A0A7T7L2M8_9ACTN|nr:fibronectin type III domain-containing protein [Streptomyces liliifuscus]QQM45206.1 fibronectin type III domain-containing protein [Streptomyces liliifuscus]